MGKTQSYFGKLRVLTILMIICLVITTLIMIILYPENNGRNGIISWVITIILLLFYLFFCFYLPFLGSKEPFSGAIRSGTSIGMIAGIIWMIHMTIDHFLRLNESGSTLVTIAAMILVLLVYGYSAYKVMIRTNHIFAALLSSLWSAMFSILILFVYSWLITFLFMPWIEQNLLGDPDYLISGMINISDYTIHHNIESAGIHLLEAPVLALIVGLIGVFVYRVKKKVIHRNKT
jgi:hypothetical protein